MPEYADLMIELSRQAENQYWVRLSFNQPDGQAQIAPVSGQTAFDFAGLRQNALKPEMYGGQLNQAVFPTEDLRRFSAQCLASAAQSGKELRTRLVIDRSALELHNLRWELLAGLETGQTISGNPNRPFSRFLATTDWSRVELRSRGNLRALVVVASPQELETGLTLAGRTLAALDIQGEVERALTGLRTAPLAAGFLEVPQVTILADESRLNIAVLNTAEMGNPLVAGGATWDNLQQHLLQGYDILYLAAHGALLPDQPATPASPGPSPMRPYLLLEKGDGSYDRRAGQDVWNLVAGLPMARRPRLVVLASCQSGGQGKVPKGPADEPERSYDQGALAALGPRLAEAGIPAVLAMQDDVRMTSMAKFIPVFFCQLLEHGQVDKAAAVARQALLQANAPDWWVPVGRITLVQSRLHPPGGFPGLAGHPQQPETTRLRANRGIWLARTPDRQLT
jgi:hypothetical protein